MITRKEAATEIAFNLDHIKRALQNDVKQLQDFIEALETWAQEDSDAEYKGGLQPRIIELTSSLTNNSGWVSYMGAAIREAGN